MKNSFSLKGLTYLAMAFVMFLASCKDNDKIDFTSNDASNVEGETTADAFSNDATDVSTDAVNGISDTDFGSRKVISFAANDRLKCAEVTVIPSPNSTVDIPSGVITIVYPSNGSCTDARGVVRKGTITITYSGKRFVAGSTLITTFTDYTVGGIKIEELTPLPLLLQAVQVT